MATRISIKRIQFEHNGKTVKAQVEDIVVIAGVIHFMPTAEKYKHLLLNAHNCKLITYTTS